jgi:hypothetical protein
MNSILEPMSKKVVGAQTVEGVVGGPTPGLPVLGLANPELPICGMPNPNLPVLGLPTPAEEKE